MAVFPAVVETNALDGTTGSQVSGETASNYAGQSVANVGDINGDGIDDFAIGATGVGGASQGAVYIVFGNASGFAANVSLSSLNGTNGFQVNGGEYAQDFVGVSVAGAGDVNGDGIDDLIIGASGADPDGGGSGAAYIVFGKNTAVDGDFAADIATSSLTGTTGFQISGTQGGDSLGYWVAGGGDFNGDGIDDMVVGALQADNYRGAAYVIFGTDSGFVGNLDVATLDGTNGFKLPAVAVYDYAGVSVANAGDINGDGIDDIIVGAQGSDSNGANAGSAYVIFGKDTSVAGDFAASVALSGLDGTNGFRVTGLAVGDQLGISVDGAGDVNGDGIDDFIVGANGLTNNGGAFVVFGKDTSVSGDFAASFSASTLDGTNGFRIDGQVSGDNLGLRVAGLGDVNGDGIDDIGVAASGQDPNGSSSGAAYVIFGRNTFGATVSLGGLDGTNGLKINGEAAGDSLRSVAGGGDFNHDGVADILVGTPFNDAGGNNSGAAWIIYGIETSSFAGTPGDDDLTGTAGNDTADGGAGNDILRGLAGDDVLSGGDLSDQLFGGDNNDILNGDAGGDLLYGEDGADTLNGGDGGDKLFGGAGADELNGGTGNDRMSGDDDIDTLNGEGGNDYLDGGTGADIMSGGTENDIYIVNDAGDQTIELANEGYDIVRADLTWTLSDNIEGLQLQGGGDIDGTGNGLANNIQGNSGANRLDGGAGVDTINGNDGDDFIIGGQGNDLLRGGAGADTFVVSHAFGGTLETDQIYDFNTAEGDIMDFSGAFADTISVVSSFSKQAGEMTLTFAGGVTIVRLDIDGDGRTDYQVKINGDVTGDTGGWLL
ncbi:MAG: FG-GAP repeat protein [Caulobacter sp.]|nr:FG-GAP repeat protein [Caulobacter sp.]